MKKEIDLQEWLQLVRAIGFAQGIMIGVKMQIEDERLKGALEEAGKRIEAALKEIDP